MLCKILPSRKPQEFFLVWLFFSCLTNISQQKTQDNGVSGRETQELILHMSPQRHADTQGRRQPHAWACCRHVPPQHPALSTPCLLLSFPSPLLSLFSKGSNLHVNSAAAAALPPETIQKGTISPQPVMQTA